MRKIFLLLLVAATLSTTAFAQNVKLGRVNTQEIIGLMPETDSATVKIQQRAEELQKMITTMEEELQKKYALFQKDAPNLTGIIAEQRQKEILDLRNKLEQFSQNAEEELGQVRNILTQPIFKKVQDAIDKVSKLNLITLVIDEAQPMFIYMDIASIKDLTPLVKQELKLKDRKPVTDTTKK